MSTRSVFGVILVAVGVGLLLDRAGYWDFGAILSTWWPLILILIGLVQIGTRSAPTIASLILVGIGLVFQARALELLPADIWRYLWPLALVILGAWLIFARGFQPGSSVTTGDSIRSFVAFGGANPRNESSSFRGGTISALFGGTEVDLRGARLAPEGARLDVTALFGGAEVIVPEDWTVRVSGMPIFGGWENKTRLADEKAAEVENGGLEVSCFVAFGGVEVHN